MLKKENCGKFEHSAFIPRGCLLADEHEGPCCWYTPSPAALEAARTAAMVEVMAYYQSQADRVAEADARLRADGFGEDSFKPLDKNVAYLFPMFIVEEVGRILRREI